MLPAERHDEITSYVNQEKNATTEELAELFQVSPVTIRRDIEFLSKNGRLVKVHGGAMAITSAPMQEIPFDTKIKQNPEAKRMIGKCAAQFIKPGDVIILDSGSTTLEVAKNIFQPHITALTNDLMVSLELARKKDIRIVLCGGIMDIDTYALSGNMSIGYFQNFHADKMFLGCDALDADFGLSDRSYDSAQLKLAMMQASSEVIAVADSSKLDKKVFCYYSGLEVLDKIVIEKIDDRYKEVFAAHNVEVITV